MFKKTSFFVAGLLALTLVGGCCSTPNGPAQAKITMGLVQDAYYTTSGILKPQIKEMERADIYVAMGIAAADAALALAGQLTQQYCPDPANVAQMNTAAASAIAAVGKARVK